jgi:hypothetical protein
MYITQSGSFGSGLRSQSMSNLRQDNGRNPFGAGLLYRNSVQVNAPISGQGPLTMHHLHQADEDYMVDTIPLTPEGSRPTSVTPVLVSTGPYGNNTSSSNLTNNSVLFSMGGPLPANSRTIPQPNLDFTIGGDDEDYGLGYDD